MTAVHESAEMVRLFRTYTNPGAPERDSTGDHLSRASYEDNYGHPLLAVTNRHVGLFPGNDAPPITKGFRHTTLGFKELAGVSHLAPAIASLIRLKELGRQEVALRDAARLLSDIDAVRAANTVDLWREDIHAEAFGGREESIFRMVDYGCAVTARYLRRGLADPECFSAETLRDDLMTGSGADELPIGFGRVVIGTFALVGANNSARMIRWFDSVGLDWEHVILMLVGRQGRPTSGVTLGSNSLGRILRIASRGRLADERIFIAPHAPAFPDPNGANNHEIAAVEQPLRWTIARVMAAVELAPVLFPDSPRFVPPPVYGPDLTKDTTQITEMPRITGPHDWTVMIARQRLALEDPRQLLASGVTDYMADQLVRHGNDPTAIVVPGVDGITYPELP
ncbi:DUF5624 domain-containing protein [Kutzneria sp. NPDC052558]|uniref:DUF5624 domain-containing protein n=1 Tax=Kutzneria sp. NPDC052558 TaxID=3364121 RepID=UPI0037C6AEFB